MIPEAIMRFGHSLFCQVDPPDFRPPDRDRFMASRADRGANQFVLFCCSHKKIPGTGKNPGFLLTKPLGKVMLVNAGLPPTTGHSHNPAIKSTPAASNDEQSPPVQA